MHDTELIVALVVAAAALAGLARAIDIHYAIVLVLGGLALGLIPGVPAPRLQPNLIFFFFLPPLTYAAAFGSSTQDLRTHARPIGILAIGLVLATMGGVAVVAHAVAGLGWGPAMVLGAILAPTDPVAATSVLRRLGAPERASTILEGEAMINDGTGLTVYTVAVAAVVSGHFALGSSVLKFVLISIGGTAVGLVAGWLSVQLRRRIDEPRIEVAISLLTAYLAYIPADRLGLSGILAAVSAGLYTGRKSSWMLSPTTRLRTEGFWEVATFLLESVLFLLIGLQLGRLAGDLKGGVGHSILHAAGVTAALFAIRFAWMFTVPALLRAADPRSRREPPATRAAELVVLAWSGLRGGVSLAAALAIPLSARGHPFPDRDEVIFIGYLAIVVTLVLPGLTLPRLVRYLGLGEDELTIGAETEARVALVHAALRQIEEKADREEVAPPIAERLRALYELRLHRLEPRRADERQHEGEPDEFDLRALRKELIAAERGRLAELRREGALNADAARRLEYELDLEESRLDA